MVNCVFTPIFSKLHCKLPLYFFNDFHTICHVQLLLFLQLFSWKSVPISSSSHLSPVSISWKNQYIQSLQKNDVIIKFLYSGIYSTLIYWVCQVLKKNCLLCCPWGCLNRKCPYVYVNTLQSIGGDIWESNKPLAYGALLGKAWYWGCRVL